jgi:hypothetical protein
MATIGQRISDLIGSDYSVIPEYSKIELINSAIMEVADMLPSELLLKYNANVTQINSSSGMDATEEKKILSVLREEDNTGSTPLRECTAVSFQEFSRCSDTDSLYEATNYSPIYTYDNTTAGDIKLKVLPVPTINQLAYVYHFNYPSTDQSDEAAGIAGLPDTVLYAVVIKACINILNTYISDFIQDEEDAELQQMVSAQIQALQAQFAQEMKRFMEQDATPRGE